MLPSATIHTIYEIGKIAGVVAAVGAIIVGIFKWMAAIYNNLHETTTNVKLLMSNHLPHIQDAIDESNKTVVAIKSDVREIDTRVKANVERMTDLKDQVSNLSTEFVNHIELERREAIIVHAIGAENKVNIAALTAAKKVVDTAAMQDVLRLAEALAASDLSVKPAAPAPVVTINVAPPKV
jgi:hypothetical protein